MLGAKLGYPDLKLAIIEHAQAFNTDSILIEDKGSGTTLIQDLQYEPGIPRPIPFIPDTDKVTRMSAQSAPHRGWPSSSALRRGMAWRFSRRTASVPPRSS